MKQFEGRKIMLTAAIYIILNIDDGTPYNIESFILKQCAWNIERHHTADASTAIKKLRVHLNLVWILAAVLAQLFTPMF